MQDVIDAIIDLAEVAAKEPRELPEEAPEAADLRGRLVSLKDKIEAAYAHADKAERQVAVAEVKARH